MKTAPYLASNIEAMIHKLAAQTNSSADINVVVPGAQIAARAMVRYKQVVGWLISDWTMPTEAKAEQLRGAIAHKPWLAQSIRLYVWDDVAEVLEAYPLARA